MELKPEWGEGYAREAMAYRGMWTTEVECDVADLDGVILGHEEMVWCRTGELLCGDDVIS